MCDPLTIGSLALSAGGAYLQSKNQAAQQAAVIEARNNAYTANNTIQQGIQKQASQVFNDTADQFSQPNQSADLSNNQNQRITAANTALANTPLSAPQTTGSAPSIVKDAYDKANAAALARAGQTATAQGQLEGYGDTNLQNELTTNAGQNQLQPLVSAGQGNARLLPIEMESAANNAVAKNPISPLGGIISAIGNVGAAAGIGGNVAGDSFGNIFGSAGAGTPGTIAAANASGTSFGTQANIAAGGSFY